MYLVIMAWEIHLVIIGISSQLQLGRRLMMPSFSFLSFGLMDSLEEVLM